MAFPIFFSQEKEKINFTTLENILKNITPNDKIDAWSLVYNIYARDQILKSVGKNTALPQFSGFKINPKEEGYYYIAYSKGGTYYYVTDFNALKSFIGTIDNAGEAALVAIISGYIIDFEFKKYAANYQDANQNYLLDVGKITSEVCPFAKSHYQISVNKKTGAITENRSFGEYFTIYGKDCKNNPHYAEIDQQKEQARLKAEEQKKKQKEINEKMELRIRKIQNKHR